MKYSIEKLKMTKYLGPPKHTAMSIRAIMTEDWGL